MPETTINLAGLDRWASLLGGVMLASRAIRRPTVLFNTILAAGAIALIGRGLTGEWPFAGAFDGLCGDAKPVKRNRDYVESTGDQSFPASDPPSWTPTSAGSPDSRH